MSGPRTRRTGRAGELSTGPANRAEGGSGPRERRSARCPPSPSARACPGVREKYVRSNGRSSGGWRPRRVGGPYLTMSPGYQATIVRQLAEFGREGPRLQGKKVGPLVHLLQDRRSRRPEVRVTTRTTSSPQVDVRFPLGRGRAGPPGAPPTPPWPGKAGSSRSSGPTTPWTLPANLALAVHEDAEYGFYPWWAPTRCCSSPRRSGSRRDPLGEGKPRGSADHPRRSPSPR